MVYLSTEKEEVCHVRVSTGHRKMKLVPTMEGTGKQYSSIYGRTQL